ncbi:uncharacterized protein KY384_005650 [Bacidia gigantensis]|uniref:uncharacterized protein n=1 Tax=Bacidia gigantensis TaxID=2732470 RepID=UPI001D043182|nr:uncharacterized protein KY384_005650 [Bacidia gigantensis]KAG8530167.1 hypothetical protein KY384_005650 [Bacidia gigantensis]
MYTFEKLLQLRVEDLPARKDINVFEIEGMEDLTSDQQEQCMVKIRDLGDQLYDKEHPQGQYVEPFDADELRDRLRSITPIVSSCDLAAERLQDEKFAYKELLLDNGRPLHDLEHGPDPTNVDGQYEDILKYLQKETKGFGEGIFQVQWRRWKTFRRAQQRLRRQVAHDGGFHDVQERMLERRQQHKLDAEVTLSLKEPDQQSQLTEWLEYQDFELRAHERLERGLAETGERLLSNREIAQGAGVLVVRPGRVGADYHCYESIDEVKRKEDEESRKEVLAEPKLQLAEKRLQIAESKIRHRTIDQTTWIKLSEEGIAPARVLWADAVRKAQILDREWRSLDTWTTSRLMELEASSRSSEEAHRKMQLEMASAEFQERDKQRKLLSAKSWEAIKSKGGAWRKVMFLERVYQAAQEDNFGEVIKRDTLVKKLRQEVRAANDELEEARASLKDIRLLKSIIKGQNQISKDIEKRRQHDTLLQWVERQREKIAQTVIATEVYRNWRASRKNQKIQKQPERKRSGKQGQSSTRSFLSTVDPGRISKQPQKRYNLRPRPSVQTNATPPSDAMDIDIDEVKTRDEQIPIANEGRTRDKQVGTTDEQVSKAKEVKARKKLVPKAKEAMPAPLRPIHSSRISKSSEKQSDMPGRAGASSTAPNKKRKRPTDEDERSTAPNKKPRRPTDENERSIAPHKKPRRPGDEDERSTIPNTNPTRPGDENERSTAPNTNPTRPRNEEELGRAIPKVPNRRAKSQSDGAPLRRSARLCKPG